MESLTGSPTDLLGQLATLLGYPVVTAPSSTWLSASLRAAEERDESIRVLAPGSAVSALGWSSRSIASGLDDRGLLSVRQMDVTDVTVRDDDQVAYVDRTTPTPTALLGGRSGTTEIWQTGKPVSWDTAPLPAVVDACRSEFGPEAAETLRTGASVSVRTSSDDPVVLLVWSAARSESLVDSVRGVAEELGIASARTVNRRVRTMEEENLIDRERDPNATDRRGSPPLRLSTAIDPNDGRIPRVLLDLF